MRHLPAALLSYLWLITPALAGGWVSGGGSAVVCRDATNAIVRAELLDIFEGRERFGMTIPEGSNDPDGVLQAALAKLDANPGLHDYVAAAVADVKGRRVFLPKHLGLNTSTDLGRDYGVYILDGCHLEQVGYFEADGTLRVATNVFDHLSPTDQAAFLLHETLYRLTRLLAGAEDSASARKLVAEILATSVSPNQLVADVSAAFNAGTLANQFAALSYEPGAKFSVRYAPGCAPPAQPVRFLDVGGQELARLWFDKDTTKELAGDRRIEKITTQSCRGFSGPLVVTYGGKPAFQADGNADGWPETNLFVSWH